MLSLQLMYKENVLRHYRMVSRCRYHSESFGALSFVNSKINVRLSRSTCSLPLGMSAVVKQCWIPSRFSESSRFPCFRSARIHVTEFRMTFPTCSRRFSNQKSLRSRVSVLPTEKCPRLSTRRIISVYIYRSTISSSNLQFRSWCRMGSLSCPYRPTQHTFERNLVFSKVVHFRLVWSILTWKKPFFESSVLKTSTLCSKSSWSPIRANGYLFFIIFLFRRW